MRRVSFPSFDLSTAVAAANIEQDGLYMKESEFLTLTTTSIAVERTKTLDELEFEQDDGDDMDSYMTDDQSSINPSSKGYRMSNKNWTDDNNNNNDDDFESVTSDHLDTVYEGNEDIYDDMVPDELDNHHISDLYSGKTDFIFSMSARERESLRNEAKVMKKSRQQKLAAAQIATRRVSYDFDLEDISIAGIYAENKSLDTNNKFEAFNIYSKEKDITGFFQL